MTRLAPLERVERPGRRRPRSARGRTGSSSRTSTPCACDELRDPAAARLAQRAAARVLEGRDRVEERDVAATLELGLERVGVEAFLVHRQRDDLGAVPPEHLQRPVVRRRLDEHAAGAPLELDGRVEDEPLEAAGREEDPARVDAVALREELSQRPVPAAGPVREDRPPVALERCGCAVREERRVEALG